VCAYNAILGGVFREGLYRHAKYVFEDMVEREIMPMVSQKMFFYSVGNGLYLDTDSQQGFVKQGKISTFTACSLVSACAFFRSSVCAFQGSFSCSYMRIVRSMSNFVRHI
jgi:pentatricopeptide repeat protein